MVELSREGEECIFQPILCRKGYCVNCQIAIDAGERAQGAKQWCSGCGHISTPDDMVMLYYVGGTGYVSHCVDWDKCQQRQRAANRERVAKGYAAKGYDNIARSRLDGRWIAGEIHSLKEMESIARESFLEDDPD